jgi:nucleotide-binding universal stress UspA family protein
MQTIFAHVVDAETDAAVLRLGESLLRGAAARVSLVHLSVLPEIEPLVGFGVPTGYWNDVVAEVRQGAGVQLRAVRALAAGRDPEVEVLAQEVGLDDVGRLSAVYGRHADLSVAPQPDPGGGDLRERVLEGLLFGSGGPVLVAPPGAAGPLGRRVLVAWDSGREAARALRDALPLLAPRAEIAVATVDRKPSGFGHGEAPGADIARRLSRHGHDVEVRAVESGALSAGEAVLREAAAWGADLIVLGGYGHSRVREFLLGGVTFELLRKTTTPLLMSH